MTPGGVNAAFPDQLVALFILFLLFLFCCVDWRGASAHRTFASPLIRCTGGEATFTLMARGINYVVICLLLLGLRGSFESGAAAPLCFFEFTRLFILKTPLFTVSPGLSAKPQPAKRRLPAEELHSVKSQRLHSSREI